MIEATYKCPNCNKQTFGVNTNANNSSVICPNCLKDGLTVVMIESKDNSDASYSGDGLFIKTTPPNNIITEEIKTKIDSE